MSTDEAKAHLVKRVEPVVPAIAKAAGIGGTVIADLVVLLDGSVESVKILDGPLLLRTAATDALMRWTFKPFIQRGKPARVITLVEMTFPDPSGGESAGAYEAYRAARYECQRQLSGAPPVDAEAACRAAVRATEGLAADRVIERSDTIAHLGQSLLVKDRADLALVEFERAAAMREKSSGRDDADLADLYQLVALTHVILKDLPKADEVYAITVAIFEAAIQAVPAFADDYGRRLQGALRRYAGVKRAKGELAAAQVLEARAAGIVLRPPGADVLVLEVVGSLQCIGTVEQRLTEDDVRQIRGLLPLPSRPPWVAVIVGLRPGAPLSWQVSVYLEPDVVGRRVRRGRIVPVLATLSSPGAYRAKKTWSIEPFPMTYAQVPVTGREPGVLLDVDDLARPFDATPFPSAALTDDEIADVVLLLRTSANAVARAEATANPPRLSRDVQPWPILRMTLRNHTDVDILLLNPSTGRGGQSALIRRVSGKWTIVELRAWGSNPS